MSTFESGPQTSSHANLVTQRLRLRLFTQRDTTLLQALAGDKAIADTMISIPHPFTQTHAQSWIAQQHDLAIAGDAFTYAVTLRDGSDLIGSASLRDIEREHSQAELSIWIGQNYWGEGYATEAGRCLLDLAFSQLNLNRIYAHYMVRNTASGIVLRKLGMRQEGLLRQRVRKWGVFEDVILAAILKEDWRRSFFRPDTSNV